MTVGETNTVISGGTHSTTLTLDDSGAHFGTPSGAPAKVTNVADGTNDYDAVNYHQLQKAYIGVASVSALTSIPSALPGKKFAIGAGYGYFEGENAVAIGLKARLWDNISVSAGAGIGVGYSTGTYTANAGFSYSF
jgi:autotransporter adhesin